MLSALMLASWSNLEHMPATAAVMSSCCVLVLIVLLFLSAMRADFMLKLPNTTMHAVVLQLLGKLVNHQAMGLTTLLCRCAILACLTGEFIEQVEGEIHNRLWCLIPGD